MIRFSISIVVIGAVNILFPSLPWNVSSLGQGALLSVKVKEWCCNWNNRHTRCYVTNTVNRKTSPTVISGALKQGDRFCPLSEPSYEKSLYVYPHFWVWLLVVFCFFPLLKSILSCISQTAFETPLNAKRIVPCCIEGCCMKVHGTILWALNMVFMTIFKEIFKLWEIFESLYSSLIQYP